MTHIQILCLHKSQIVRIKNLIKLHELDNRTSRKSSTRVSRKDINDRLDFPNTKIEIDDSPKMIKIESPP